jgi:hypothetical protein
VSNRSANQRGKINIIISSDLSDEDETLEEIDEKTEDVKGKVRSAEREAVNRLERIQAGIAATNALISLFVAATGRQVDIQFIALLSSLITFQQSLATFAVAQAAIGNLAALPVISAAAALLLQTQFIIQSEQSRVEELIDQNRESLVTGVNTL